MSSNSRKNSLHERPMTFREHLREGRLLSRAGVGQVSHASEAGSTPVWQNNGTVESL